jgi:hypothetical protein
MRFMQLDLNQALDAEVLGLLRRVTGTAPDPSTG